MSEQRAQRRLFSPRLTRFRCGRGAILAALLLPGLAPAAAPGPLVAGDTRVEVLVTPATLGLSTYRFTATAPGAIPRERTITERTDVPRLRSASPLLDGLFALAMAELEQDRVNEIRDDAFNDGKAIACACFETGERWHYVWTRDVSYATDLGLALLDPERARASLLFKTSGVRAALLAAGVAPASLIAQDTGSGGSWPISTDRVVWIHAAMATLGNLDGAEAERFAGQLGRIAADTLAQDREFAFDASVGLYRGETSFLDWREQNYPRWTAEDTRFIAESFALSTNVLHYAALKDAAQLARRAHDPVAATFEGEAAALKAAINRRFWLEDAGLYVSYLAPGIEPLPVRSFDLLGLSLAVIHGIADPRQAHLIARRYPSTAAGPPVLVPQQPGVPIYHNRAIWPFVTAYGLRSAVRAREPALAARMFRSLERGAATALSNQENFEFLSGATSFADGALSGPVINSPRQLWSVAAFAGAVAGTVFGIEPDGATIRFAPYLPGELATELGGATGTLTLENLRTHGLDLTVTLHLPRAVAPGAWLAARGLKLNGRKLAGLDVALPALRRAGDNRIDLDLVVAGSGAPPPPLIEVGNPHALTANERALLIAPYAPPAAEGERSAGVVHLVLPTAPVGTNLQVYRDGQLLSAAAAPGAFTDRLAQPLATACYTLVAWRAATSLASLPSAARCFESDGAGASLAASDPAIGGVQPGALSRVGGREVLADWGAPGERLTLDFTAHAAGTYRLRLEYLNAHGPVNTGITAAVKRVSARCGVDPAVQDGTLVMPHVAASVGWALSTAFVFRAGALEHCRLELSDGFNMSYLEHFAAYTAGAGGRTGPLNRATLGAFRFDYAGQVAKAP